MAKYIFSTKFKKIEKEPLYYNIQVSVDKDYTYTPPSSNDPNEPEIPIPESIRSTKIYKDTPILLTFISENYWESSERPFRIKQSGTWISLFIVPDETLLGDYGISSICKGTYPLPETISVVKNGVTFTFTPIPVYE